MKKLRAAAAALLFLTALLTGCQSDLDMRYLDASMGDRLELPPDLIEYEAASSFELPEAFSGDDASVRDRVPVLARVESLRLEGSEDFYWLSVEEPVDNLYQMVKNFWAAEGYRLIKDEPVIGVMETEWIVKEVGSSKTGGNWFERLFDEDDLSAIQDQFKTRIERDEQGRSRIFIAHRGAEYNYVLETDDKGGPLTTGDDEDSDWRYRPSDPELETEMLSRLMIYLGLQREQADQRLESVKLFQPRAFMRRDTEENSPFLVMKDPYPIAWNRVYHNLERLNVAIESAEFKAGILQQGFIEARIQFAGSQQEGGLFSLGSDTESGERTIFLVLSEETHELTRIDIEDAKGESDTSPEGAEFLKFLYRRLK
ncbi:MAG: outer membrane protein assembly factor BamC [Gammaproteobacteria bacterium]|jgi:outer membrane protein assembly factor BamC|nr:outer membrane protein assembly factor BamC [Gammaproteobacteria bacterium]